MRLAADVLGLHRGIGRRGGALDESPRRGPQLELQVPVAGLRGCDVLLRGRQSGRTARDRNRVGAPRGAHRRLREVDGAHPVIQRRLWPRNVGVVVLADAVGAAGAVVVERVHAIQAHGLAGVGDHGLRILRHRRRHQRQ